MHPFLLSIKESKLLWLKFKVVHSDVVLMFQTSIWLKYHRLFLASYQLTKVSGSLIETLNHAECIFNILDNIGTISWLKDKAFFDNQLGLKLIYNFSYHTGKFLNFLMRTATTMKRKQVCINYILSYECLSVLV